jgi:hypothetical protein
MCFSSSADATKTIRVTAKVTAKATAIGQIDRQPETAPPQIFANRSTQHNHPAPSNARRAPALSVRAST